MPTMILNIPESTAQKLNARATSEGRDAASLVIELVEQGLCEQSNPKAYQQLSHEDWLREFEDWVNSHPKVDVVLDVSRESIYEGRGE